MQARRSGRWSSAPRAKRPRTDAAMRKDPNISFCSNFALDNVTKIIYRRRIIQNFPKKTGAPPGTSARLREGGDQRETAAGGFPLARERADERSALIILRHDVLCCECSKRRRRKRCPLPLWERAAQTAQQKEWVRGPPHPIEFVAITSLPSPTRGEGKAFHSAFAARPGTSGAGLSNPS